MESRTETLESIRQYIRTRRKPAADIQFKELVALLRGYNLTKAMRIALDTKSKSLGGFISYTAGTLRGTPLRRAPAGSSFATTRLTQLLWQLEKIPSSTNAEAEECFRRIHDDISYIIVLIENAPGTTGNEVYCPLCWWRYPALGEHSLYCRYHLPESAAAQRDKPLLKDIAKRLGVEVKVSTHSAYTAVAGKVRSTIKGYFFNEHCPDFEEPAPAVPFQNLLQSLMLDTRNFSKHVEIRDTWGDGQKLEDAITQLNNTILTTPRLKAVLPAFDDRRFSSVDHWLDALARAMSEGAESDPAFTASIVTPLEIYGALSRYQQYLLLRQLQASPEKCQQVTEFLDWYVKHGPS